MTNLDQTITAGQQTIAGKAPFFESKKMVVSGKLCRIARLRSEDYEFIPVPSELVAELTQRGVRADLFTFRQGISELEPKYPYHQEWDQLAVVQFESYENWWKNQIKDKTRNMVRKAGKKGVNLQFTELTDDFVRGIQAIYNECPIRQGKPSRHYGKDFDTLKREHASFLDCSEFIGAYSEGRLIGFVKVVYHGEFARLMNIIALVSERDKAPTNALLAKTIERCAEKGIHLLQYGIWSRRSFGDFKLHNAFKCHRVPRYYVPLNGRGRLMLKLGLHRNMTERMPEKWVDRLVDLKSRWYTFKYRKFMN